jgi:hypothetical protein
MINAIGQYGVAKSLSPRSCNGLIKQGRVSFFIVQGEPVELSLDKLFTSGSHILSLMKHDKLSSNGNLEA